MTGPQPPAGGRKIMGSDWGLPPDGTLWTTDVHDMWTHELIKSFDIQNADAERVSDALIEDLLLVPPFALAANPIRVESPRLIQLLEAIGGIQLNATAQEIWLTVVAAPAAPDTHAG